MKNRNIIIAILILLISGSVFTSCGSSDSELEKALESGNVSSHGGFSVTVNSGSGDGSYLSGVDVVIKADTAPPGQEFDKWVVTLGDPAPTIVDASASSTTLTMSTSDAAVKATYKNLQYALTVINGTGSSNYAAGDIVTITANAASSDKVFDVWVVNFGSPSLDNANATSSTLTMSASVATVTATYKNIEYALTVNNGSGDGNYETAEVANISADPAPQGQEFDAWEINSGNPTIVNLNASSTTLTMKASAATVTATYRDLPIANAGDDMEVGDYDDLEITLDGSGSSNSGTGQLSYSWKFVSSPAPNIMFNNATLSMPSFTPVAAGTYVIELIVNNGISDSLHDTVIVNVIPDIINTFGMKFKSIQGGTFKMGNDQYGPVHNVTLTQSFYMQTTEVTQGQWQWVLDKADSQNINYELDKQPSSYGVNTTSPVETVSWDEIKVFIGILNQLGEGTYRLPTEAEWEYAARAGSITAFSNGTITETGCGIDANLDKTGWYCYNSKGTKPVMQKEPNI